MIVGILEKPCDNKTAQHDIIPIFMKLIIKFKIKIYLFVEICVLCSETGTGLLLLLFTTRGDS